MSSPNSSKLLSPAHRHSRPRREAGKRLQTYEVRPSDQLNLFHGLPFQKYNLSLLQSSDMQLLIVSSELHLLTDKAKALRVRLREVSSI